MCGVLQKGAGSLAPAQCPSGACSEERLGRPAGSVKASRVSYGSMFLSFMELTSINSNKVKMPE